MEIRKVQPLRSKTSSICNYIIKLFKQSLLTGVPEIFSVRNKCRKFWKIFVLCNCFAGFFYQTSYFLKLYRAYPVMVDFRFTFPAEVKLPAVTVCNFNGLSRNRFCSANPEKCETPSNVTQFCKVFDHICKNEDPDNIKIPKKEYRLLEKAASRELVMEFGQKAEELFVSCELEIADANQSCPEVSVSFVNFFENVPRICHTLNGRYRTARYLPMVYVDNEYTVMTILLNLDAKDYFRPDRPVIAYISIHTPDVILDPFDAAMLVEEGRVYDIRPTEEISSLLPKPYDTNCSDKIDVPHGLETLEGCIDNCILHRYYEKCKCIRGLVVLPDERRFCVQDDQSCLDEVDVRVCNDFCPRPCKYSTYNLRIEKHQLRGFKFNDVEEESWAKRKEYDFEKTMINIIIQHPPLMIKNHIPKYQTVEFFSHIGGYVGIWLGMSLIALFDFLEMIVLVINFSCRKIFIRKRNVKRVAVIEHPVETDMYFQLCNRHRKEFVPNHKY